MPFDATRDLLIKTNTNVALALYRIQEETSYPYSALSHIRSALDYLHHAEGTLIEEADRAEEAEAGNA